MLVEGQSSSSVIQITSEIAGENTSEGQSLKVFSPPGAMGLRVC